MHIQITVTVISLSSCCDVITVVNVKIYTHGRLLQPLRWCCVDCVIHHERDVREEQYHTYTWREQAVIE